MNQSISENEALCIHRLAPFFGKEHQNRQFDINEMKQSESRTTWSNSSPSGQKEATSWNPPLASCRVPDLPVPVTPALWTLITTLQTFSTTLWTPYEPIKDALTSPRALFKLQFPRQALNAAQRPSCHPNWHQNLSNRTTTHGGAGLVVWKLCCDCKVMGSISAVVTQ